MFPFVGAFTSVKFHALLLAYIGAKKQKLLSIYIHKLIYKTKYRKYICNFVLSLQANCQTCTEKQSLTLPGKYKKEVKYY